MQANLSATLKSALGVFAAAAIAGCSSDLTGGNTHPVQLSFTTHVVGAPANAPASDQAVDPAGDLVLQKVQLVFGKLELDRTGTADCVAEAEAADDDHEHMGEECEDVSHSPFLVDVPVDATLHPLLNVPLAAGTYSELEAKLEPARDRFTDFNAAHPDLVGNSVRVEGTFKGTPFVFTAPIRAEVEMEFDPPLVIDETTRNATVSLDVSKWFLDESGNAIDPATATPESTAFQRIEQNIRQSFHAFEDDSERGEDHHEGHEGNDDGGHH
ncbi:MAG TPA: hypothetical protein VHL12_02350 [Gemmatimonadaceae bacterium]|jgi:hypothetical protein|nr:hypothetical protein [Gemmatimonadaceae bacterium]